MKFFYSFIFFIATYTGFSQEKYAAILIPDSLKKDARLVSRLDETSLKIKSPGKANLHSHVVFTVLNSSGDTYANMVSHYNKFRIINSFEATLYNAFGKEIRHIKKKDMKDLSGSGDEELMTDTRYKQFDFYCREYPYTIEVEEDDDLDGLFFIDPWQPYSAPGMAIEQSSYSVTIPDNYTLRYKAYNNAPEPTVTNASGSKIFTWQMKNKIPVTREDYGPPWLDMVPRVMFAPSAFEIDNYSGDMSSWQTFGKFVSQLNANRDILPDNIKKDVHALTDNVSDKRKKINILYNYLQQNSRYIAISLGIGSWQPFDANFVASKKYGDCKALSNYMVALLKEANIKANYVLIAAGDDQPDMLTDFPSPYFNHATVCVPMDKDSIWLECTSQTLPAGYIGSFTGNRHALLINESGGQIVTTKKYTALENTDISVINGTIDAGGKLTALIKTKYAGFDYFKYHARLNYLSKKEQLDKIKDEIDIANYDVDDVLYSDNKCENASIDENIKLTADNYANISGKRLFITPNIMNKLDIKLDPSEKRRYDVVYKYSFRDIDTIQLQIPDGYSVEAMPKDVNITNQFGSYNIHYKTNGNTILLTRSYERIAGKFPPTEYNSMVSFYNIIYKADHSRIVFVKKEG